MKPTADIMFFLSTTIKDRYLWFQGGKIVQTTVIKTARLLSSEEQLPTTKEKTWVHSLM